MLMSFISLKWNEEWSPKLWTRLMQLHIKEPEKIQDFKQDSNPWPRDTGAVL